MKRLRNSLILSLLLISCGQAPKAPSITLCITDIARQELVCGKTNSDKALLKKTSVIEILKELDEIWRIPINESDKYICLPPDEFKVFKNYVDLLEEYSKNHCK